MALHRTTDLAAAVPEAGRRSAQLIRAVDRSRDGILQESELDETIAHARSDAVIGGASPPAARTGTRPVRSSDTWAGRMVRSMLERRFGRGAADRPDARAKLEQTLKAEHAARTVTINDLRADLTRLCKDPSFDAREVGTPGYDRAAQWVADQLEAAGIQPLGELAEGRRTYFHAFRWRERFGTFMHPVTESKNVIGVLPGTGPEPREAVLVIAHLDNLSRAEKEDYHLHEGRDFPSYEGANDNGAAVAAALEIARGLSEAGGVKRDVVFLFPSAEEEGLKGTEAFCMKPPIPLDRFVGVVNMEMIGQNAVEELLVYGGESNLEAGKNPLYARTLAVAERAGIHVQPGPDRDDGEHWYGRSDHFVTANAGIPSIMLHGRADPGHYHTADDTLEKLNLAKVQTVARLALRVVLDLGDDDAPKEKRGTPKPELNDYSGEVWP